MGLAASPSWMIVVSSSSGPSGLRTRCSPTPDVGLGGLVPRPDSTLLGGLPFASSDFREFRAPRPRVRIDDLSAPSGRFVGCVSAVITTVDRHAGRGAIFPAADTAFASVFAVPSEGGTGSAEAPAAATAVAQHAPFPRSTSQGVYSTAIAEPAACAHSPLGDLEPPTALRPSSRMSTRPRRRTVSITARRRLLMIKGSGLAGALVHPTGVVTSLRTSHGRDRLWPSLQLISLHLAFSDDTHSVRPHGAEPVENSSFKTSAPP